MEGRYCCYRESRDPSFRDLTVRNTLRNLYLLT